MDSNEKKGKRPRIGARPYTVDSHDGGVRDNSSNDYAASAEGNSEGQSQNTYSSQSYGDRQQRPYQPRNNYNRQGGYQNNRYGNQGGYQNNRYGNQGGYQPRQQGGYQPRPHVPQTEGHTSDSAVTDSDQSENSAPATGYQPRNNYNRQGGYQPRNNYNRQQGGYQPRQQGG